MKKVDIAKKATKNPPPKPERKRLYPQRPLRNISAPANVGGGEDSHKCEELPARGEHQRAEDHHRDGERDAAHRQLVREHLLDVDALCLGLGRGEGAELVEEAGRGTVGVIGRQRRRRRGRRRRDVVRRRGWSGDRANAPNGAGRSRAAEREARREQGDGALHRRRAELGVCVCNVVERRSPRRPTPPLVAAIGSARRG